MFSSAPNPYDEIIGKATDENLASEDWALNLEVCDKVSGDGQAGARNAVGALQKRLSHRNPNVQLYALELANTLAQNCGKPLLEELSSRNWTGALDRLVNDRATAAPVKKKALGYIKSWAKQFEDTGDANLGMMGELYDQLRAKNMQFDEPEPVPEDRDAARRRQEDEELQRVLELSKQDRGGRTGFSTFQPSSGSGPSGGAAAGGSSSSNANVARSPQAQAYTPAPAPAPVPAPEPEPVVDLNTATRVRALYTFTSAEVGELNFERGDVIKVLDRGFKEWWRGACNGKIGIFPVTYVEAIAEPSPRELQEEAQEEARVFASLGLVDQLLQTLKGVDTARGDRLDDKPEIEEMYQASVGLQGQINALIKKYSDQKAELEHMNANFLRAMRQYEDLRSAPPPQPQYGYAPPQDPYGAQYAQYPQQPPPQHTQSYQNQQPPSGPPQYPQEAVAFPLAQTQSAPQQSFPHIPPAQHSSADSNGPMPNGMPGQPFYHQQSAPSNVSVHRVPSGAPGFPPQSSPRRDTEPGAAGVGAGKPVDNQAAWDAYYRQQGQAPPAEGWQAQSYPDQQQQQQGYGGGQYPDQTQRQGSGGPSSEQVPGYAQVQVAGRAPSYGQTPYVAGQQEPGRPYSYASQGVDGVTSGVNRMTVHGQ